MKRTPRSPLAGMLLAPLLAAVLAALGLVGCSAISSMFGPGAIAVDLSTPNPDGVSSVYVIVGDDLPLVTDSREIIELVEADKQASYRAFVQYAVDPGPRWVVRKQTGSGVVKVAPAEKSPDVLQVRLGRKILENEATCLAIVTSNKMGEFRMLHWDKTSLDLVDADILYEITAEGFRQQIEPQ